MRAKHKVLINISLQGTGKEKNRTKTDTGNKKG